LTVEQAPDTSALVRIQISNLSTAVTEPQIRAMFLPYGPVQFFDRPKNEHTRRPGPLAYIEMAPAAATAAIKALRGTRVGGEVVTVAEARQRAAWAPESDRTPSSRQTPRVVTPPSRAATPDEPRSAGA